MFTGKCDDCGSLYNRFFLLQTLTSILSYLFAAFTESCSACAIQQASLFLVLKFICLSIVSHLKCSDLTGRKAATRESAAMITSLSDGERIQTVVYHCPKSLSLTDKRVRVVGGDRKREERRASEGRRGHPLRVLLLTATGLDAKLR